MKQYLFFSGYNYYPCGGWDDFKESFDTIEDVIAYLEDNTKNMIGIM